jgi:hypothetical protein
MPCPSPRLLSKTRPHFDMLSFGEHPQVLVILNQIWEHHPNSRPSFIAYNDACDLLRHIVTQNLNDAWLSTKFIVDTWHYLGHRATDILCRLWCNPAPKNSVIQSCSYFLPTLAPTSCPASNSAQIPTKMKLSVQLYPYNIPA